MTTISLALLALVVQSSGLAPSRPQERNAPDSELVADAKADPLAAREAVADALRAGDLVFAQRLAVDFWKDERNILVHPKGRAVVDDHAAVLHRRARQRA